MMRLCFGGGQEWVNPALAGVVQVRASSPSCRYTDPKALLSGHFLRTNRAGPRYEAGHPVTWWLLDLGTQSLSHFCLPINIIGLWAASSRAARHSLDALIQNEPHV